MKKTVLTLAITILSVLSGIAKTSVNYTGKLTTGTCTASPSLTKVTACATYTWNGKTYNTSGVYEFATTTKKGCDSIAKLDLTINKNTINLTSAVNTDNQSICINSPSTLITYATVGATGASFVGLPSGVTGYWGAPLSNPSAKNQVNISGTPSVAGIFKYTVTLTGGCGVTTATGTIEVKPKNTIKLTSLAATAAQSVCKDKSITNITYATTTATGATTTTTLPTGVSGVWNNNVFTISGTPTVAGTFTYTVTTVGGCSAVSATGTINSKINTIALSSAAGTDAQKVCKGTAIIPVTYATTNATGATLGGTLPTGVTGTWAANKFTISGTPTQSGLFNYTITLTGGCEPIVKTGTLEVKPDNTILLSTPLSDVQTICAKSAIVPVLYNTTGATGATISGLPLGVKGAWANDVVTLSGNPYVAGTTKYTVTLTGGCKALTATGTITVATENTLKLTSAAATTSQTVKVGTKMTNITYATTGATAVTIDLATLPSGITRTWANNILTISGTPTAASAGKTFNYDIKLTGVCAPLTVPGKIIVAGTAIPLKTISESNIEVTSYPNPFSTAFKMNVVSQSEEPIAVQITDMVGRIVENHVINSFELSEKEIGEAYPVGVYNVVLTQGSETTTFRIVKQ